MLSRLWAWGCALAFLAVAGWLLVVAQAPERARLVAAPQPVPGTAAANPGVILTTPPADVGEPGGAAGTSSVAGGTVVPLPRGNAALVSAEWASGVAQATGIPERALLGYAGASLRLAHEAPACRLGWNTLAALGAIESGHGTHAGSAVDADGVVRPSILGPLLDGSAFDAIADTDRGRWDGNAEWDRAVGPLQFIPATWQRWGADGNGDGVANAQQIDDAALAAGRYLCSYGDLSVPGIWRTSIFAYNHVESYVNAVAATANEYAAQAAG